MHGPTIPPTPTTSAALVSLNPMQVSMQVCDDWNQLFSQVLHGTEVAGGKRPELLFYSLKFIVQVPMHLSFGPHSTVCWYD